MYWEAQDEHPISTLRKRKAEDSPQGGQKSKHSRSMQGIQPSGHPKDRPGKVKGYPYQMHDKTEYLREARRLMQGIEPSGDPRDAPREVKGAQNRSKSSILGKLVIRQCNGSRATRPISRVDDRLSSGKGEIEDRV
jgi:hypothetical protein